MSTRPTKVAIVGAGLAGNILAHKICRNIPEIDLTLIGPDDVRQQRISGWLTQRDVSRFGIEDYLSWQTWSFTGIGAQAWKQRGSDYHYVSFETLSYKNTLQAKAIKQGLKRCKESVHNIDRFAGEYALQLDNCSELFDHVIDTRPPYIPDHTVKQQFIGQTLAFDYSHGIDIPILMDFNVLESGFHGVEFIYLLPVSCTELLVEATAFSSNVYPQQFFYEAIQHWLDIRLPTHTKYRVIHEEFGTLPMGQVQPIDPDIPVCGLAGGAARPSTGYAFLGIQRQTDHIINSLKSCRTPISPKVFSNRSQWMDHIFLQVLKGQPNISRQLFIRMAQQISGDDMARFMNDEGGWLPCIKTILAAPKWPFLKAAIAGQ